MSKDKQNTSDDLDNVKQQLWSFVGEFGKENLTRKIRKHISKARPDFERIIFTDLACLSLRDVIDDCDVMLNLSKHDIFVLLNVPLFLRELASYEELRQQRLFDSLKSLEHEQPSTEGDNNISLDHFDSQSARLNSTAADFAIPIGLSLNPEAKLGEKEVEILEENSIDNGNTSRDLPTGNFTLEDVKQIVKLEISKLSLENMILREDFDALKFTVSKMVKLVEATPETAPVGFWIPTEMLPTNRRPDSQQISDSKFGKESVPSFKKDGTALDSLKKDAPNEGELRKEYGTGRHCFTPRLWHTIRQGHGRRYFVSIQELSEAESYGPKDLSFLLNAVFGKLYIKNWFYIELFPSDLEAAVNQLIVLYAKTRLPKGKSTLSKEFGPIVERLRERLNKLMYNHRKRSLIDDVDKAKSIIKARLTAATQNRSTDDSVIIDQSDNVETVDDLFEREDGKRKKKITTTISSTKKHRNNSGNSKKKTTFSVQNSSSSSNDDIDTDLSDSD